MTEQDPQPVGGQLPVGDQAAQQAIPREPDGKFAPGAGRWKPGESGNPSGRPKGSHSLTGVLKRRLAEEANEHGEGKLAAELAELWIEMIRSGEFKALAEALARIDGLPVREEKREVTMRSIVLEDRPGQE